MDIDLPLLRMALECRRRELIAELQSEVELPRDDAVAGDVTDLKDAAEARRTSETLVGLERVLRRELGEIEDALARLEAGTYGACLDCGDPVPAARLRVVPAATRCASCQEAREHEARARDRERLA
jgi:RNA polymerase-binding transcription factor DksA